MNIAVRRICYHKVSCLFESSSRTLTGHQVCYKSLVHLFKNIKINNRFIVIFTAIAVILFFASSIFLSLLFNSQILPSYYLESEYLEDGKIAPLINAVIYTLIFVFVYLSKSYSVIEKDGCRDNFNMFIILAIGVLLSVVNLKFALFSRVTSYFTMFTVVLLPNSLCNIKSKKKYILYMSIIFIFFILYYLVVITFRPYWIHVYPYEFCF